ncbi:MAG: hypothetical protein A3G34_13760 [Candidatus Lindowbacteria bacterium RIFCSPLOWO2_12_FULL_62_27]|nr:MAG: hypothetical protein A3I06_12535 [Candidatus Lindowbacteria bacterium RIFCSPLOWO2_02_FULL_62_12]OGH62643.1 MAG: hypothetical protein A3G34_13760 [Candidatus Lindowbacteria bacterium RIFCSPLOWO2_12_FULL_62_27]
MRFKIFAWAAAVFLASLFLAFPYDAALRFALARRVPAVSCESIDAAPWGARLSGVRVNLSPTRVVLLDECHLYPAGLFPPAVRLKLRRGNGRIALTASGWKLTSVHVDAEITDLRLNEILPGPAGVEIAVQGSASCLIDAKAGRLLEGGRIKIEATGDWGQSSWAVMLGSSLREGHILAEPLADAVRLTEIRLVTDQGGFEGAGEIRPSHPIRKATLALKGRAAFGQNTMTVDRSIPISNFLSTSEPD